MPEVTSRANTIAATLLTRTETEPDFAWVVAEEQPAGFYAWGGPSGRILVGAPVDHPGALHLAVADPAGRVVFEACHLPDDEWQQWAYDVKAVCDIARGRLGVDTQVLDAVLASLTGEA